MGSYYSGVMNSNYDSELKHFGILGQKLGIRRFQNPDGTLTTAGKERYGDKQEGRRDTKTETSGTFERVSDEKNEENKKTY